MAYVASGYVAAGYVEADETPASGYPSQSDVRQGVVYGLNGEYTGTYVGGNLSEAGIASAVLASLMTAVIPVNMVAVKGQTINGSGSENDPWGP